MNVGSLVDNLFGVNPPEVRIPDYGQQDDPVTTASGEADARIRAARRARSIETYNVAPQNQTGGAGGTGLYIP